MGLVGGDDEMTDSKVILQVIPPVWKGWHIARVVTKALLSNGRACVCLCVLSGMLCMWRLCV